MQAAFGGRSRRLKNSRSGAAVVSRPIAIDGMGEKNTRTQKTENRSHSLKHRRRPWPSAFT
jgi:hypothetical protein